MSERSRDLPRRSCLSIPGSSDKMLGKGPGIPADMVFLDLEDAVAPKEKEAARGKVAAAISGQEWGDKVLCVRVERLVDEVDRRSTSSRWWATPGERLDEIMLPKVESAAQVVAMDMLLSPGRDSRPACPSATSASRPRSRRPAASSTSRRSAPRRPGWRRSSSARPTSPRRWRCRCSPAACRSPTTPATTSTTCSPRS